MQLGEGENKTPKSMPVPVSAPVPTSAPRAHLRPYLYLARCLYLHMYLHLYLHLHLRMCHMQVQISSYIWLTFIFLAALLKMWQSKSQSKNYESQMTIAITWACRCTTPRCRGHLLPARGQNKRNSLNKQIKLPCWQHASWFSSSRTLLPCGSENPTASARRRREFRQSPMPRVQLGRRTI